MYFFIFAVGKYGDQDSKRYKIDITSSSLDNSKMEQMERREAEMDDAEEAQTQGMENLSSLRSKNFFFVQTDDGTIPSTSYSREEDPEVINVYKAITASFQANFKGTRVKEEADPQSLHKAKYRSVL